MALISYTAGLGLATSNDTLARPGTWIRIDPTTGDWEPGFKSTRELPHPQLLGFAGGNGAIIRDTLTDLYHVIFNLYGSNFLHFSTVDFDTFSAVSYFYNDTAGLVDGIAYPTAIGTDGDALTTNGKATIFFGGQNETADPVWGRPVYAMDVDFTDGESAAASSTAAGALAAASSSAASSAAASSAAGSTAGSAAATSAAAASFSVVTSAAATSAATSSIAAADSSTVATTTRHRHRHNRHGKAASGGGSCSG